MSGLSFDQLRRINVDRCTKSFPGDHLTNWSLCDWMTALAGEVGEAANIIKKLRREYDLTTGFDLSQGHDRQAMRHRLASELADVQCYLDLLAASAGIDLGEATIKKFNEVSQRVNYPVILDP